MADEEVPRRRASDERIDLLVSEVGELKGRQEYISSRVREMGEQNLDQHASVGAKLEAHTSAIQSFEKRMIEIEHKMEFKNRVAKGMAIFFAIIALSFEHIQEAFIKTLKYVAMMMGKG